MKKRVIVGMSGGVDSSVAAALLKEQGFDVIGVYILGWTGTEEFPCNWQTEEADARAVAAELGIPFYTLNLSKEYEQEVIDRFFAGYDKGQTPNPDILCNREIKFKAMWRAVRQFEPDFVATGHYARILNQGTKEAAISTPKDDNKNQTYFLWGIEPQILPHLMFPLGELTKAQVRELAKKYNLITAGKKDSQGICFVGPLKVRSFLKSRLSTKPGNSVLTDGRNVATHEGVHFYTIGQRLGAGSVDWTGDIPPLFVVAKDLPGNRLVVGTDQQVYASRLIASQVNWLVNSNKTELSCLAKVRYRQESVGVSLKKQGDGLLVEFDSPVRAITAGQSIVFYDTNGILLGGAIIERVPEQEELLRKLYEQSVA